MDKNDSSENKQKRPKSVVTVDEVKALQQELGEMRQKWMRAVADYQNLEKRLEKEKQEWIKFANVNLLGRVLDVADNIDRAAIFVNDPGLTMVRGNLQDVLKEFGVTEIDAQGKEFDPNLMECIDKKQGEENKVLEVVQKGYKLHDRVLRPAKVVVGKKS